MDLELSFVELVSMGFGAEYLLDLDVESFDILVSRATEVKKASRFFTFQSRLISAQGDQKGIKAFQKALTPPRAPKKQRG